MIDKITKAAIFGDTHADRKFLDTIINQLKDKVDAIIQVGDFGYWPDDYPEMIEPYEMPVYFIDGNHEQHQLLQANYRQPINKITDNLYYINRGEKFVIQGTNCLFIGGASSIDYRFRKLNHDWFKEESITYDDLDKSLSHSKPIDVVISHDCPLSLNMNGNNDFPKGDQDREKLDIILNAFLPKFWFFGHWHKWYENYYYSTNTVFIGLQDNRNKNLNIPIFDFKIKDFNIEKVNLLDY